MSRAQARAFSAHDERAHETKLPRALKKRLEQFQGSLEHRARKVCAGRTHSDSHKARVRVSQKHGEACSVPNIQIRIRIVVCERVRRKAVQSVPVSALKRAEHERIRALNPVVGHERRVRVRAARALHQALCIHANVVVQHRNARTRTRSWRKHDELCLWLGFGLSLGCKKF